MRRLLPILLLALVAAPSPAATLEKLTLEEMIRQSTAIVRGKVVGSSVSQRGPLIYTHWKIRIAERWKGEAAAEVEVVTPGGSMNGVRQAFSGAPTLVEGTEYVLFLWTGKSGLTHLVGLTQGLFDLRQDAAGNPILNRPASTEVMLDSKTGREVNDEPMRMRLSDFGSRIRVVLGAAR